MHLIDCNLPQSIQRVRTAISLETIVIYKMHHLLLKNI